MPNDIQDFTEAVTVSGGTVVVGSGSVTIVGGQGGVNVSMDSPPLPLGNLSVGVGATTGTISFNLPSNATGLLLVPTQNLLGAGVQVAEVKVTGGTSGWPYLDVFYQQIHTGPVFAAIAGDAENPVQVTVNLSAAATAAGIALHCYAVLATGVQQVYTNPYQPLDIRMSQGLTKRSADFSVNLANGATQGVVPQLAGATVVIYGWQMMVMPSSGVVAPAYFSAKLQDNNGVFTFGYAQLMVQTAAGALVASASQVYPDGYAPSTPGIGMRVVAGSSVATQTTIVGTIQYAYR